jgi:hypothetical protein
MGWIIPIIKRKGTLDIAKLASGINLFAHHGMTKLTEYKLLLPAVFDNRQLIPITLYFIFTLERGTKLLIGYS